MKAEELMIGDWVLKDFNYDSDYEFDNVNYKQYQITDGEDIDLASETNMLATDSIYKPIPLTPEILEKNGFNRLEQTAVVEPYYWFFFDKETEVKIKAFNTIYRGLWVECINPVNNASANKQCEFVHELQHILKDLEIKKEIIL